MRIEDCEFASKIKFVHDIITSQCHNLWSSLWLVTEFAEAYWSPCLDHCRSSLNGAQAGFSTVWSKHNGFLSELHALAWTFFLATISSYAALLRKMRSLIVPKSCHNPWYLYTELILDICRNRDFQNWIAIINMRENDHSRIIYICNDNLKLIILISYTKDIKKKSHFYQRYCLSFLIISFLIISFFIIALY